MLISRCVVILMVSITTIKDTLLAFNTCYTWTSYGPWDLYCLWCFRTRFYWWFVRKINLMCHLINTRPRKCKTIKTLVSKMLHTLNSSHFIHMTNKMDNSSIMRVAYTWFVYLGCSFGLTLEDTMLGPIGICSLCKYNVKQNNTTKQLCHYLFNIHRQWYM